MHNLNSFYHIDAEKELIELLIREINREILSQVLKKGTPKSNEKTIKENLMFYEICMKNHEHYNKYGFEAVDYLLDAEKSLLKVVGAYIKKIKKDHCEGN